MSSEMDRAKRRAVAMRYDKARDGAPRIVAKGKGHTAERIIEIAREHGLHVHHDPALVSLLAKLDVDREIPEELYKAVAEVLAFVYQISKRQLP